MVNCGTKLYPQMADSYLSTFSHTSQDIHNLFNFNITLCFKQSSIIFLLEEWMETKYLKVPIT